jgi:hypothetical protein
MAAPAQFALWPFAVHPAAEQVIASRYGGISSAGQVSFRLHQFRAGRHLDRQTGSLPLRKARLKPSDSEAARAKLRDGLE